jgi:membrane-associated protease RseP (regulator of RpoE activity)
VTASEPTATVAIGPSAPAKTQLAAAAPAPAPTATAVAEAPTATLRVPARRSRTPAARVATADNKAVDAAALADIMSSDLPSPRVPTAAVEAAPAAAAPVAIPGDAIRLPRADVNAALADFAKLTSGVHGSFSASGAMVEHVAPGTIFARAGLQAGDVVAAVDGVRLRSLDDAASVYAKAGSARLLTAQVIRNGKPITLHIAIQ